MSDERPLPLQMYETSAQGLVMWLTTGSSFEVEQGIPKGATVRDAGYDPERQVYYVTVEHPSFELVYEGATIPRGDVNYTDTTTEAQ